MTFFSLAFILFVAAVALVYFIVPKNFRWIVLLAGSYVFYWLNSEWLVFVLLATSMVTFGTGLLMQKVSDTGKQRIAELELSKGEKKQRKKLIKRKMKWIMLAGIILVLGVLLFLKYYNFFGQNFCRLLSLFGIAIKFNKLQLLLPLGISFYTLQAIAYLIDIYRGKTNADKNPFKFMLFMSFFPQIVQGPIPRHSRLAGQLYEGHSFSYKNLTFGAQLFIWGLMKKLIIAERLAIPVNYMFDNYKDYTGPIMFFSIALYGLMVYTDFSGGMDIARGVAQMLGITLESNFEQPYFSTSIEDFWRRWHITMGSWMREYIFYPLSLSGAFTSLSQKSRKVLGRFVGQRLPAFLAMFIVYFLVGFWHGANWKYVAYGLWNGLFIMISILLEKVYGKCREKCRIDDKSASWRMFCIVRTFIIVSFGRFFSGAPNLGVALSMFGRTFSNWKNITFITNGTLTDMGLNTANWICLLVAGALLFLVDFAHERNVSIRETIAKQHIIFRWAIYITAIIAILIFGLYGPEYDAASFIYEQF